MMAAQSGNRAAGEGHKKGSIAAEEGEKTSAQAIFANKV
ncbi:hypothetical protein HNP10_000720 [Aeromonas veronii]|nr:hypothetical protein [Aeromonas veronii]